MWVERQPLSQAQMSRASHCVLGTEPISGLRSGQKTPLRPLASRKKSNRPTQKFQCFAASSNGSGPSFSTQDDVPRTDGDGRSLDERMASGEVLRDTFQSDRALQ